MLDGASYLEYSTETTLQKETSLTCHLENSSCFEFLKNTPDNSVNLVIIDPPYDISRKTGFKSGGGVDRFAVSMDFGSWDWGFEGLDTVITEAYRVLKKGGTLIVFYDLWKLTLLADYMKSAKFKQLRFMEWVKTNPVPINSKINYLTNAREIAISGVKGSKPTFNSSYDRGIYSYPICHEEGRFHPTQKPLALIRELIEKHSNEGDTVLDCFSGSGTSAVASISVGRHFTGCELDKTYWQKSYDRVLAKSTRQVSLTGRALE